MPVSGRHDAEVREGLLAPAQEPVALGVALELEGGVHLEGVAATVDVGDDRVVDHEVDRDERVDLLGAPAEGLDGVAHRGEVDDARHAGEVLQQDPGRRVGDLPLAGGPAGRTGQRLDIARLDAHPVLVAKQVLEEELDRVREPVEVGDDRSSADRRWMRYCRSPTSRVLSAPKLSLPVMSRLPPGRGSRG